MYFFYIYRMVMLILSLILTIPLLGLLAHWTAGSVQSNTNYVFEPMGLFISCVTVILLPVMLALPQFRKNAFVLYVVSELSVVCLLWILWVVAAALAIQNQQDFYPLGNCTRLPSNQVHWCNEMFAIVGLSAVVFTLLLKYTLFLFLYAIIMSFRIGSKVWFQSVKDIQLTMPKMTHNAGDLEAKARRDDSSTSIPMNTYPMSAPAPTPAAPQFQPQYSQPQYNPPQLQQNVAPRSQAVVPSQLGGYTPPSQAAMQVTPTTTARVPQPQQNGFYNPAIAQV